MTTLFQTLTTTTFRSSRSALTVRQNVVAIISVCAAPRRNLANAATLEGTRKPQKYERGQKLDEDRQPKLEDISSIAHGELEQHREIRHYARIAAYEMPSLAQLAKSFVPPTETQPLRFRYTTYMGEEHPAESKVVVEFAPQDLPLAPPEQRKLIKLAGVRYNPDKQIVRISCEMFDYQVQNKRYLSDLVDRLIAEAQDQSDTFEDIPFDFRHNKVKKKIEFPWEWVEIAKQREQERHLKTPSRSHGVEGQ